MPKKNRGARFVAKDRGIILPSQDRLYRPQFPAQRTGQAEASWIFYPASTGAQMSSDRVPIHSDCTASRVERIEEEKGFDAFARAMAFRAERSWKSHRLAQHGAQ
jgi:hypothetical protein